MTGANAMKKKGGAPPSADEALWTSAEAASATKGRARGRWTVSGISIDSRTIAPGELFAALQDQRDGHEFVADARGKGATAVLVSRTVDEGPALVVKDTLEALRGLAKASRERCAGIRVAVTGSVGKTTVKEALAAVFRRAGRGHASEKSYNNHWGVPLSLARMPRATQRAVFEIGMNHQGEIQPLAELVRPDVAVITKIGPAHLEGLGSMEAIADEKAQIFQGLVPWGAAIIPGDDAFANRLAEHAGWAGAGWLVRFGTGDQDEARLASFEADEKGGGRGAAEIFGHRVRFRTPSAGRHWAYNATAVLAASYLADAPLQLAVEALADLAAPAGRGAAVTVRLSSGAFTILDDSYNANPTSMEAAISTLGGAALGKGGRRIAVLGEMLELGPDSAKLHAALAKPLRDARVDAVHLVGEGMTALAKALPKDRVGAWTKTSGEILETVCAGVQPGDIVLVKGSNAAKMAAVVEALRKLEAAQ
jgi:UDP-N-acetylmuramoyl-tripeptide--D-alanyl-D-alanine ligase